MWSITALDYEVALLTNAEAREGAGMSPMLWAKWKERGLVLPTRQVKGGRGGQYAAKDVFRLRLVSVSSAAIGLPPSEAIEIAKLASKGSWNVKQLAAQNARKKNWRGFVLRESPRPLDVFLIFSKTDNCWGYELALEAPTFKNSASVVIAAARELIAVSKYCWNVLQQNAAVRPAERPETS
jgi:hypothetical protein